MENIFIAIVTNDKEYGRSLSLGMLNVYRGFIIRIFSAEEFLTVNREYDLVLWDGDEVSRVYGGRIIYLAEKPSDVAKNIAEKRFSIYKYSTAAAVVATVFEIYEVLTGRRAVNLRKQDVHLFAFSSCEGGTGCTTVAMAAAQELCRFHDKKVMYLSFEEWDSIGNHFDNDSGIKGVAVYLFELFNKKHIDKNYACNDHENPPFLDRYIIRDDYGVEAFAASQGRNPLRELNTEELNKFIASLIDSGRFDVIIMDMGQWMSKTGLKCLEFAEKILMVTDENEDNLRFDHYICHMVENCGEDILRKMIRVINGFSHENKCEDRETTDRAYVRRGSNFIRNGKQTKIILEGEFGNDVAILADKMIEPLNEPDK